MRSSRRVLQESEAALRSSDPALTGSFDTFTAQARAEAAAMPSRESLWWFGAKPLAVLIFAVAAVVITAVTAFAMSAPGPCIRAYQPKDRPSALARTAYARTTVHLPSCQVTGNAPAQPSPTG